MSFRPVKTTAPRLQGIAGTDIPAIVAAERPHLDLSLLL